MIRQLNDEEYVRESVNTLMIEKSLKGQTERYKKFDYYEGKNLLQLLKNIYNQSYQLLQNLSLILLQTFIGELPDIVQVAKKMKKTKLVFSLKNYDRQFDNHILKLAIILPNVEQVFLAL